MALMTIIWSQWILASDIMKTMNSSADPCDDFYKYACGNYTNQVILPDAEASMNSFIEADKTLRRQLKLMFQAPSISNDSQSVDMVKKYYRSCMNVDAQEKLGLQPMKSMMEKYGGWPMVVGDGWNGSSYEWLEMAARTYRDFGISRILLFNVKDDYKNTSKRIMEVDQPKLGLGKRDYYLNANYSDILNSYRTFIHTTAVQLGADESRAKKETDEIIKFETELAKITVKEEDRRNYTELYNPMTVAEMKKKYPKIPFHLWFDWMAQNGWKLNDDQIVDVPGVPYLNGLPDVLAHTDTRVLANYQLMSPVLSMVPYLAPSLRDNYKKYRQALFGSKEFKPRWEECVLTVRDDLDWPASAMYIKEFFKVEAKDEVETIVQHLTEAMKKTIEEASWMDGETEQRAQEKLKQMVRKLAFPDDIFNETKTLQDYTGVELDETGYFTSALSLAETTFNEDKRILNEVHNRSEWDRGPALVNAFYWPEQNSITFPAGILQHPFFILNAPRYINYGRIGAIIGHEITHGYDDQGRQFDGEGRLNLWWTEETLNRYQAGTKCFVDQYSKINDEETGLYLNGLLELGENIADNGGVKLAHKAYAIWKDGHPTAEQPLPDLDLTPDQLFFIGYAQQWCDVMRPEYKSRIIITDPHAPSEYRVNVPMQNFPAFAEAFHCPKGSNMYPKETCVIW